MVKGVTLWFTGLPGSGKTTVARRVHELLQARHILSERLDGDVVRQDLCRDLGFSKEDREKNIERVTFVSKVLTRNGVVVLCSFVSPYRAMRDRARQEIGEFLEVYVRAPQEVLTTRDVKGMYRKALAGGIQGFTGIDDPYEEPNRPDLVLDTDLESVDESAGRVMHLLAERGYLAAGGGAPAVTPSRRLEAPGLPGPPPHGGVLVDRELQGESRKAALERAKALPKFGLDEREMSDLELIGYGALSPLTGFMRQADYETVLDSMRLSDGLAWPLPVNLATSSERARELAIGQEIALTEKGGRILALMTVTDLWTPDKSREVRACFGTEDSRHPGVARVLTQGDVYVGGPVWVISRPNCGSLERYRQTPLETRRAFEARGWKRVVAFPARRPLDRGDEYITKVALELGGGLWLHPMVGASEADVLPADAFLAACEVLRDRYYPSARVHLSVVPAPRRFAGEREDLWHAVTCQNYGCTHVILHGREGESDGSAGPDVVAPQPYQELAITPMRFGDVWWCPRTGSMATSHTSPVPPEERDSRRGAGVHERLRAGALPPGEVMRPEVAAILAAAYRERARVADAR